MDHQAETPEDTSRPCRNNNIRKRKAGPDLVLYDPEKGRLHVLNTTASKVWELCDGTLSVEQITEQVVASYSLDAGTDVEGDVKQILGSFSDERLLGAP